MYAADRQHRRSTLSHERKRAPRSRGGFTLVELLVSIAIFVILTALVLAAFQRNDSDRLNASARLLQSYFEGARSRAISEDRPRGVRLIRSTTDRRLVDSLVYIGSPGYDGDDGSTVQVNPRGQTSTGLVMSYVQGPLKWTRLGPNTAANPNGRNLIQPGFRIEIPRDSGSWYVVSNFDFPTVLENNHGFFLEGHYSGATGSVEYRLEMAPTILPNTEPVPLERGMVIDLDASQIPFAWRAGTLSMDFLFDGRGSPMGGTVISNGLIHLYLTTLTDVEMTRTQDPNHPGNTTAVGPFTWPYVPARAPIVPKTDPYLLSLFTQAGQVTTSQVNPADVLVNATGTAGTDFWADDPYSYARRGREAQ